MIGDTLKKLGITEEDFLELLRLERKPYRWLGERVTFDPQVQFTRPPIGTLAVPFYDGDFSAQSWANTTAFNTVIPIVIPPGTLEPNFGLFGINQLSFINNTGSTHNLLWRVYDGSSYYPDSTGYTDGVGASANLRPYTLPFAIQSNGSAYLVQVGNVPGQADQLLSFTIASDPRTVGVTLNIQIQMDTASPSFILYHHSHLIFGPFE